MTTIRNLFALLLAAFTLAACGESPEQKAYRERQEADAAKWAAFHANVAKCKEKNGDKHFGPLYGKRYNGVVSTANVHDQNKSWKLWLKAQRDEKCVVWEHSTVGWAGAPRHYRGVVAYVEGAPGDYVAVALNDKKPD